MAPKSSSPASSRSTKKTATTTTTPTPAPATTTKASSNPPEPGTTEAFTQELQALAAKAQSETWTKRAGEQLAIYAKSLALLSLIAAFSTISQLNLSPVYGAIPAAKWHAKLLMAACFVGWSSNLALNRALPFRPEALLPVLALWTPALQFFLAEASGKLTATWGPLVTEGLTLFPVVTISVACVATTLEGADLSLLPGWLADAAPGLGSYGYFKAAEKVLGFLLESNVGRTLLNTRLGMEVVLGGLYALLAPSKLLLLALPALLHTALLNTHVPTDAALAKLNAGLAEVGYTVLDRAESITGYISVVDSQKEGYRVLRCDHSLLGGEWVKFANHAQFRYNQVAEPIYGVFTMLEAVRLVETAKPVPDHKAKALVIGLGIGTTPAALVAHGVDTTIVELDPIVHKFASKYFKLPSNHTAVIEDAVTFTNRQAANETAPRYDYIIHDVFTGGAEPIPLFTLEFLQNLHTLLNPNGVVAINYAGDFALPPPRIVYNTIRAVFPTCRMFREHPRDDKDFAATGRDFTNMVIFCTKQKFEAISFREPTIKDMLNSPSRNAFLMPKNEVLESDLVENVGEAEGVLARNSTDRLVKWHEQSAMGHWAVMRTVLPEAVWKAW
ncbi:hypothetical protein VTJ83DRAFT_5489 [Remersonia thermophila]|uniref:Spermine/spermidine synthase n=1 Tax=Remersonia thermophila TaxID=72144 RepID=A0ABR4D6Z5_9PEZI